MYNSVKNKNKKIFDNKKTFVIGEIGLNHNGRLENCIKMIDIAKKSGFDAVKLQISDPKESYFPKSKSYKYFKKYSLCEEKLKKVFNYAKKKKIILFSTFGDLKSLKYQDQFNFPLIKISSGLITNIPLIKKIAKKNKPIILSTGMAFESEIVRAIKTIKKYNSKDLAVLVCTSIYPCKDNMVNLNKIISYKKKFKTLIGYSDHTQDNFTCISSVLMGAKVIEKHITFKKLNYGDHKISADFKDMPKLISGIRRAETIMGKYKIGPNNEELKVRKLYLRKIISKKKIIKGETFNLENISLMRSSYTDKFQIDIKKFDKLLGKKNLRTIKPYKILTKKNYN